MALIWLQVFVCLFVCLFVCCVVSFVGLLVQHQRSLLTPPQNTHTHTHTHKQNPPKKQKDLLEEYPELLGLLRRLYRARLHRCEGRVLCVWLFCVVGCARVSGGRPRT